MKSLKITKLLSLLTTGITAGGIATGGLLVGMQLNNKNGQQADDRIDLSDYSGALSINFTSIPTTQTLLTQFAADNSIEHFNNLNIQNVDPIAKTFRVVTQNNSSYFKDNTYASCSYTINTSDIDWTLLTGNNAVSRVKVFEDTEISRNEMLNDLSIQYPTLVINQLYIDASSFNQDNKSVTVRTVTNSNLYAQKTITLTAGFAKATEFTYSNSTLTQTNNTSGTTTFKYKDGAVSGVTYTSVGTMSSPVTLAAGTGVVTLTTGVNFDGALYTIKATYIDANSVTWIEYQQVYVQKYSGLITVTPTVSTDTTATRGITYTAGYCYIYQNILYWDGYFGVPSGANVSSTTKVFFTFDVGFSFLTNATKFPTSVYAGLAPSTATCSLSFTCLDYAAPSIRFALSTSTTVTQMCFNWAFPIQLT